MVVYKVRDKRTGEFISPNVTSKYEWEQYAGVLSSITYYKKYGRHELIPDQSHNWEIVKCRDGIVVEVYEIGLELIPSKDFELTKIKNTIKKFTNELREKLTDKYYQGYTGWDDPSWKEEDIVSLLKTHIEKGDMVDVAAFAMFLWNKQNEKTN